MHTDIDEKAMVALVLSGQTNEFQRIIEKYERLVAHIVFKMIPREAEREDICQEVFVKAYKKLSSFKFESKLSTWLGRIAFNTSINYLDKKKAVFIDDLNQDNSSRPEAIDPSKAPDQLAELQDTAAILRAEIDRLPPYYRTVVTLFHLDELSYSEIFEITGLPEGTVKSHLFRARKMLKERLQLNYNKEDLCQ